MQIPIIIFLVKEKVECCLFLAFNPACAALSHDKIAAAYNLQLFCRWSTKFYKIFGSVLGEKTLPHQYGERQTT
jgi:hypothetical protein